MQALAREPVDTERQDVCLPWGCELRESCARNMEHNGVVVTTYFHPKFVGEFCEHYVRRCHD